MSERAVLIEALTQNFDRPLHRLAELKVTINGQRWIRFVAVYGEPPGSHFGFWRTRYGSLRGINLRVGKRYIKTLTLFVHTSTYSPLRQVV
jgi:hypothetical protein